MTDPHLPPLIAGSPVARALYAMLSGAANVQLDDDLSGRSLAQLCEVAIRMTAIANYPVEIAIPTPPPMPSRPHPLAFAAANVAGWIDSMPGLRCEPRMQYQRANLVVFEQTRRGSNLRCTIDIMVVREDGWPGFDPDIAIIHPDFVTGVPAAARFSARHFLWAPSMTLPDGADQNLHTLNPAVAWGGEMPVEVILAGAPA